MDKAMYLIFPNDILMRTDEEISKLIAEAEPTDKPLYKGEGTFAVTCDVVRGKSIKKFREWVTKFFGRLEIDQPDARHLVRIKDGRISFENFDPKKNKNKN